MDNVIKASAWQRMGSQGRDFSQIFAASAWRHRLIHALALASLALAVAVGFHTGNMPDTGVVSEYGFFLLCAFWIGGCGFAVARLFWLAAIDRDPAPTRAFLRSFRNFFASRERAANSLNGIAAFIVFASGFSVLKGAIALLAPFTWDQALSRLDLALHFGRAPYEWLWWLAGTPGIVRFLNLAYNFWFVILIGSMFTVSIASRDTRLRHQYLMALILVWTLGGFFMAMGFSSAGPCYFSKLGFGDGYQPLMDALGSANRVYPIWALSIQDMLWNGYTGATKGSIGISAFPSMHVATAVLFALYAQRRSWLAGALLWAFAAVIMVASVVLGWHYAVDGYAGALLSLAIWKATGYFLARFAPDGVAAS